MTAQQLLTRALRKSATGGLSPSQRINRLAKWITTSQLRCLRDLARGEEGQWFLELSDLIAGTICAMPITYSQDGKGDAAVAHLHYFTAGGDFYITERDAGSPEDAPEDFQTQAFGMRRFSPGSDWRLGYINIPDLLRLGAEMDFHFVPQTLGAIRALKS